MTRDGGGASGLASAEHPLLYQVNTRILLAELARRLGRAATLDDLPDALLDELRERGFHWLWPLGMWRTGEAGVAVSRRDPRLRAGLLEQLPDLSESDITGSPFAIRAYEARSEWGGPAALARLRARLARRDLRLLLDFVPNHIAPDHPWIDEHPEYLMAGTEADLAREPLNYVRVLSRGQERVFAYGRDPYFAGWPDTLQLNYAHAGLQHAMIAQLLQIAGQCDGVRCDMAMLLLPDVFERTWGERAIPSDGSEPVRESFWAEAIRRVRGNHARFVWIAEAYWDLEWRLQREGFDFTYDKRLYDRLRSGAGAEVRAHLLADAEYQRRSVRFLENHDEPRAAEVFPLEVHRAAAVVAYLVPGLRLFHEGQLQGRRSHVSMHVGRRREEAPVLAIADFYMRLLATLRRRELHEGQFVLHGCRPVWDGNASSGAFVAFSWVYESSRLLVTVNLSAGPAQCYVDLGWSDLAEQVILLEDVLSDTRYERSGQELSTRGLYLDLPAWSYHVFDCRTKA